MNMDGSGTISDATTTTLTIARCDEEHHTDVHETPVASSPLAGIGVRAGVPVLEDARLAHRTNIIFICQRRIYAREHANPISRDDQVTALFRRWNLQCVTWRIAPAIHLARRRAPSSLLRSGPDNQSGGGKRQDKK
jgi:hypothetical protein